MPIVNSAWEVLDIVYERTRTDLFPPTVRDIQDMLRLSSTDMVARRLRWLSDHGLVHKGTRRDVYALTPEGARVARERCLPSGPCALCGAGR